MRASRELLEHPLGRTGIGGLGVDPTVEHDRRVDAEHETVARFVRNRPRLAERVIADELRRIGVRRIVLLILRGNRVERDLQLFQDRAPLRRRRRQ